MQKEGAQSGLPGLPGISKEKNLEEGKQGNRLLYFLFKNNAFRSNIFVGMDTFKPVEKTLLEVHNKKDIYLWKA